MKSLRNIKKQDDINMDQLVTEEGLRRQIFLDELASSDIKLKHINRKINQRARMVFVTKKQMYEWRYQYLNSTLEPTDWYTKWPNFTQKIRELIVERYLLISSICNKVLITDEDIKELAELRKWSVSKTQKWLKRYRSFELLGLEIIEQKKVWKKSNDSKGITIDEWTEINKKIEKLGPLATIKKPTGQQWKNQATIADCHYNTLKTIHKAYFSNELYLLVRQERADKGISKGLPPDLEKAIVSYRLVHRGATPGEIYDFVIEQANINGLVVPSLDQVYFVLDQIPLAQVAHADKDWTKFRNHFKITGKMTRPYGVLTYSIDWTKVPVLLKDLRGDNYRSRSGTLTAYLTMMIEFESRKILSFQLGYNQPNKFVVAGVFLEGVISHGYPDELIHDSGSAEKAKHIKLIAAELSMLPFQLENAPQQNGRVERLFGTMKKNKAPRIPGFTGTNPSDRLPNITPKLTIFDLDLELREYFDEYNNDDEHSSLDGFSPAQYFSENIFAPKVNPNNLSYLALSGEGRNGK